MNRKKIALSTHNCPEKLTPQDEYYSLELNRLGLQGILQDLGEKGDITSKNLGIKKSGTAQIITKEKGIMSGGAEIKKIIELYSNAYHAKLSAFIKIKDSRPFKKGDTLLEIKGNINDILIIERTILNILQRMCGIATSTFQLISKFKKSPVLIASTRKTPYGLLDKKAVVDGGGATHRLNLSDAILIKDTHLDLFGRDVQEVLGKVLKAEEKGRFIEIEVQNMKEAIFAAETFKRFRQLGIIMCDNFTAPELQKTLKMLKYFKLRDSVLIEASGGITAKNISSFVKAGADIISLGELTHSVKAINLSLKMMSR